VLRDGNIAMNISDAYDSRQRHRDENGDAAWGEWTEKHPDQARIINSALVEYERWLEETYG